MVQSVSELTNLLRIWEDELPITNYNPIPTLTKLCEVFEVESKNYLKKDPDPFDNRHPSRIDPQCALGQMYKILFSKDSLLNNLFNNYLNDKYWLRRPKENFDLNVVACRLVINLIPSSETTVIFKSPANNKLIQRLFSWAENGSEPLQTFATGLLASCMELGVYFKEDNNRLVPIILNRVHSYFIQLCEENDNNENTKPFSHINNEQTNNDNSSAYPPPKQRMLVNSKRPHLEIVNSTDGFEDSHQNVKICSEDSSNEPKNGICGDSNSSWATTETSSSNWIQVYPPTLTTKLVYCLKYLVPTGKYQEFLIYAYEKNYLNLVMKIIDSSEKQNVYLTFEALKYLSALICHKKIVTEFIASQGLQKLLLIPKPSLPTTGVSFCLYNLSYCEEAMEKICLLPENILVDLVKYELWMLECSHDSSRCYATMFFSCSFHFRVIREIFDNHDGLRKLINVVSTLKLLSSDDPPFIPDDYSEFSIIHIIDHVCASLKHYFVAHLHIKAQQIHRAKMRDAEFLNSSTMVHNVFLPVSGYKSNKKSQAEVYEEIELLSNDVSMNSHWTPVDQFIQWGGLNMLLKIVKMANEWSFPLRYEAIKNALEVINICAVLPKVQLLLCEPSSKLQANYASLMKEDDHTQVENGDVCLSIIIKSAEGELLDPDIQKAALSILITCVCAPTIHMEGGSSIANYSAQGSAKKQTHSMNYDVVIKKIWDCIRNNNGIMILLTLMTIETPITDVDAIRGLATRALTGLARCESVRQIISKLPLFNTGQLQNLMKNPVLQEKRQEHLTFQKYALELMELVSGKTKNNGAEIEASFENINRANIVAQTKINFSDHQLLLLIHQHLAAKGLSKTVEILVQEANLSIPEKKSLPFTYVLHCGNRSMGGEMAPLISKHSIHNQKSESAGSLNDLLNIASNEWGLNSSSPIRLNVKRRSEICPKPEPEFELPMSKLGLKKIDQDLQLQSDAISSSTVSLESIVTEYLTNQHASCKHPIVTCPTFNLFIPHKCPDSKPKSAMCTNFAMRFSKNIHSRRQDQRLIHSRFYPTRVFHMDDGAYFTCCQFLSQNRIAIGNYNGEIKVFNTFTGQEESAFEAHYDYFLTNLECSNDEKLLLTSATSTSLTDSHTSLWELKDDQITLKYSLNYEEYCTFSNYYQTKLLGTTNKIATIYDLETSHKIMTLDPKHSNQYIKNRAVFDATNELVLSDGVLWDSNSGKEIYKFDKLNQYINGIFHPSGLEIISNTEVWDMRTFQLLRTVSNLNLCNVMFSDSGEGMYAYTFKEKLDRCCHTSFKTLDPHDYSNIATFDVEKCIYYMACNKYDTQIAIVENQRKYVSIKESGVRIYDVGRSRNNDETVENEDNEDVDSEGSGSEDDNLSLFPSLLENVTNGGMNDYDGVDHFSGGNSSRGSNSRGSNIRGSNSRGSSRSYTPMSLHSSVSASYGADYVSSDPEVLSLT